MLNPSTPARDAAGRYILDRHTGKPAPLGAFKKALLVGGPHDGRLSTVRHDCVRIVVADPDNAVTYLDGEGNERLGVGRAEYRATGLPAGEGIEQFAHVEPAWPKLETKSDVPAPSSFLTARQYYGKIGELAMELAGEPRPRLS